MSSNNTGSPKLYQLIIDSLIEKIERNQFSFESPLCTEAKLMEEFHVSRITAKRAITELEYRGILYRKRGVGSFVARDIFQKKNKIQNAPKLFAFVLPFAVKQQNMLHMISKINTKISNSSCFFSLFITDGVRSREQSILKQLLMQNVAGVLFYPSSTDIHLEQLHQFVLCDIPVIVLDQPITAPYLYNVICDNVSGAQMLVEHLISLNHKKIGFLSTSNMDLVASVSERFGGYLKAMKQSGLLIKPEYIVQKISSTNEDALKKQLLAFLQMGITAIICDNDSTADTLIHICHSLNISVPDDISICGFSDDYDNITSICLNEVEMAEHIGDIFMNSLSPSADEFPHKILVPAVLHEKSSTGPCPLS